MGGRKIWTDAEAVADGLAKRGAFNFWVNKYSMRGRNTFAVIVFTVLGLGLMKSRVNGQKPLRLEEARKHDEAHKQFIAEKDKWMALGKKFDYEDWKKF